MIENFLQESIDKAITTVANLLAAVQNGTCDNWPTFRALGRTESAAARTANWVNLRNKK